jgi:hypothetical protein
MYAVLIYGLLTAMVIQESLATVEKDRNDRIENIYAN